MLTFFTRPPAANPNSSAPRQTAGVEQVPTAHRTRFNIEVACYHSPAEMADWLATPPHARRVVLFGGEGPLPAELAEMTERVVRLAGGDPYQAAVLAFSGLTDGDTLTVLLPADWDGPPAEALLEHANRWFASPHSSEDEQTG